ncbi:3789_t:CDS:2 [Cetraspora pellucida]|uniref:3789_t:CDS:1 n=1 Tax=Cetraspora pellucida TaxID=1433469 RepID=A0A9N8ZH53_9GLOM|nr:3789_t:CDS:2 [Cetraspora pellucida]
MYKTASQSLHRYWVLATSRNIQVIRKDMLWHNVIPDSLYEANNQEWEEAS